jgi:hypothetical protein
VSCHDIERVRLSEIRFPSDLVHNGRSYLRGVRSDSLSLMCATRRHQDQRREGGSNQTADPQNSSRGGPQGCLGSFPAAGAGGCICGDF